MDVCAALSDFLPRVNRRAWRGVIARAAGNIAARRFPVEAELRIADQYFGAAKEWLAAINAGGYCGGTDQLGSDIVGHLGIQSMACAGDKRWARRGSDCASTWDWQY